MSQDILLLGYSVAESKYPRIFCRQRQNVLGYFDALRILCRFHDLWSLLLSLVFSALFHRVSFPLASPLATYIQAYLSYSLLGWDTTMMTMVTTMMLDLTDNCYDKFTSIWSPESSYLWAVKGFLGIASHKLWQWWIQTLACEGLLPTKSSFLICKHALC